MHPKSAFLLTLSTLALGAASSALNAQSDPQFYDRCQLINQMGVDQIAQLAEIARDPDDPCSTFALQRLAGLGQPALGPGFDQGAGTDPH